MRGTSMVPFVAVAALGAALLAGASALAGQTVPESDGPAPTLTLDDALGRALERDPELEAAHAQVDAAAAGRAQARAGLATVARGSGTLNHFQEPMVVAPLHGFDPTDPPAFDPTLVQARLDLGWTVFDGGARGARIDAARAREAGADAGAAGARMDAILEVLDAYLRIRGARDALDAQRAREETLAAERARAERFVAEGAAARVELLRAEAELDEARARGVGAEAALAVAEAELARLVGLSPEAVCGSTLEELRSVAAQPSPVAGGPAADHPLLLEARGRVAAAEAGAREARAAWLPRIAGTGSFVEYRSGAGDHIGEWQLGVRLEYPLFSGGARRARVAEAQAEARRVHAEARAVERALATASDRAQAAVVEAAARAEALATALARFEELARMEALALDEGVGVQADYLRALTGLHDARVGLAEARRAAVLARVRLVRIEGRLDLDWIRTNLEAGR